ncbi:MAG: Holliday junction resolvase RuvX [Polyangiaceae bacterium]|nr:Holliday junction resolvase RuvX [Polyangiaceae bacterium]
MGSTTDKRRVAAIDLGKVRVGLAISDELGLIAHPRPHLDGRDRKALLAALAAFAREEGVGRFLVGLPLDMDGGEGIAARRAASFAQAVADATGVEVELVDERLTTVEASRRLREGGVSAGKGRPRVDGARGEGRRRRPGAPNVDGAAAAVLLQAWLDRGG